MEQDRERQQKSGRLREEFSSIEDRPEELGDVVRCELSTDKSAPAFPLHTVWKKTEKLIYQSSRGFVAYEVHDRSLVVAGDPLPCASVHSESLLIEFIHWAHERGYAVCGYYFSKELAVKSPLIAHKAGVSSFVDLNGFSLAGQDRSEVRRALNQGHRSHLQFREISSEDWLRWKPLLQNLEEEWLATKKGPRIQFLLSSIGEASPESRPERVFVVLNQRQEVQAFVTALSYFAEGSAVSFYIDQMIQVPGAHKFALDYLLSQLILQFKAEGLCELCLGFNAFCGIEAGTTAEFFMKLLGETSLIYRAKSLHYYKSKFSDFEVDRFLLLDPEYPSWPQLKAIVSATYGDHYLKAWAGAYRKKLWQWSHNKSWRPQPFTNL